MLAARSLKGRTGFFMIYFIQDTTTGYIKIGYSKDPKKRLEKLEASTPHDLVLLGAIQGGLEHEAKLHKRFTQHGLKREWFKGEILQEVLNIIAMDGATPQRQEANVIVAGDSDIAFTVSSDKREMEERTRLQTSVNKTLSEIHAKTLIAKIVTGGDRQLDCFAWEWAKCNDVKIERRFPNWRRYRSGAASQLACEMVRGMFDQKLLLVFLKEKVSTGTRKLLRTAEKAGIEIVKVTYTEIANNVTEV
jgi:hypothetical protein